jgi:cell division septation protein DedD
MVDAAFRGGGLETGTLVGQQTAAPVQLDVTVMASAVLEPVFEESLVLDDSVEQSTLSPMPYSQPQSESEWSFDFLQDLDLTNEKDEDSSDTDSDETSQQAWHSINETGPPNVEYVETPDPVFAEHRVNLVEPSFAAAITCEEVPEDRNEEMQPISAEAASQPNGDPLFSWDYSSEDWPMLVGPGKRRSHRKLRALVTLAVLTCVAGFYFLISQPASNGQRKAEPSATSSAQLVSTVAETRPAAASVLTDAPKPASSSSQDTSTITDASQPIVREVKTSSETQEAGGRFSLQAAAFPTQAAANEFAEKLKRAGVASYVASADLARRGRWFRVRLGRFDSAAAAQTFAREMQLRAKAASVSLQLIVCQYD